MTTTRAAMVEAVRYAARDFAAHSLLQGDNDFGRSLKSVSEALTAAAEALEAEAWRPIESAPRDGTPILCWMPPEHDQDGPGGFTYVLRWHERKGRAFWMEDGGEEYHQYYPSHWRPLPPPPEAG